MDKPHDPDHVGRHDEHQLRQFLAARRAGDEGLARRWWDELVRGNFDRVEGMVRAQSYGHLSAEEQDDAIQNALIKITNNMILTFKGTSMGEWVECTRTLLFGTCVDVQRKAVRVSKHEQAPYGSAADEGDTSREDADMYRLYEDEQSWKASAEQEDEDLELGREYLTWALPQLSPQERAVMQLALQGRSVEEIQAQLDVSRDVVYASRSRALKRLGKLHDEYPR